MKPPLRARLPLFELSILLVLLAMGRAVWEMNLISKQQSQFETQFQQKQLDTEEIALHQLKSLNQRWELSWKQHLLNQSNVFKSFFQIADSHRLREAYLSLADRLQAELPEMHAALVRYASQTNHADLELRERKGQEMRDWLRAHKQRLESERLIAKSHELALNGKNPISDLAKLCREIESGLANYTNKATLIGILARNPAPTSYNLSNELAEADKQIAGLLEIAGRARHDAARIEASPLTLPDASSQFERELAQAENEVMKSATLPSVNDYSAHLQTVSYAMWASGIGLFLFLVTAVYRRVVVEKLRVRLYESTTENKLAHLEKLAARHAHEIKQPITAINAWLWTLQKGLEEGTPQHTGAVAIRKEINRLDQIAKDFLRFTQPAAPKLVPLKAEPVLRELVELLRPQLEHQRIELNLEDSLTRARFSADPQQLKQVLINLIQNAAESIEHDGKITLRARKDRAQLKGRRADVMVIEVEDSGPGIPPDVQQRLFDPFFSTKESGTGLGLPIAANIIDRHGGALEFKTDLGKGTIFGIVLPIFQEAA